MDDVSAVYECIHTSVNYKVPLEHESFREFCLRLKALRKRSSEREENDEDWAKFLRLLSRYAYFCSGLPIPFNSGVPFPANFESTLERTYLSLSHSDNQLKQIAAECYELFNRLRLLSENPMLDAISHYEKVHIPAKNKAIVIRSSQHVAIIQQYLTSYFRDLTVLTSHALRGLTCFQRIYVIGSPIWHPPFIFNAPRAEHIYRLCYGWHYSEPADVGLAQVRPSASGAPTLYIDDLPTYTEAVSRAVTRFVSQGEAGPDANDVAAHLVLLPGHKAVFLEWDEHSKWYVLDLEGTVEEASNTLIERVAVKDIKPGMFVLLRTSGGGDYIVEVADATMGPAAAGARNKQLFWKAALRKSIQEHGPAEIVRRLKLYGALSASKANLRNWASKRSIRTNDKSDFTAIMKVVGLGTATDALWANAEVIDSAHRSAGMQIRRMLLEQVKRANLSLLVNEGEMTFSLEIDNVPGGSMTAFRVFAIQSEEYLVPSHRIGKIFSTDEDSGQL